MTQAFPMTGEIYDGRYQAKEVLGRGAFGVVYRGEDINLGRQVAIKVLAFEDPTVRQRFLHEARVLASLEHPNIVPIYAFGEQDGCQYFVMRYVSGPLLSYAAHGADRPAEDVVALVSPLAQALDFAHSREVIHRDLKPSNICFTEHNVPVLLDFGLARGPDQKPMTQAGQAMGTPQYMSPEQARSQPPTAASDQYALGVILYELLTGTRPFDGESPLAVVFQQVSEPPPPPRERRPDLPEHMADALLRALAKDPAERFPSCQAFLETMGHDFGESLTPSPRTSGRLSTAPPAPASESPRIRVLVVEDEVTDVLILKRQLDNVETADFVVDHVLRLAELQNRLAAAPPDVVLLDLALPDSQGLATLDAALALVGTRPVVVQTGEDDETLAREALQRGAQDFVVKGRVDGRTLARAILYAYDRAARPAATSGPLFDADTGLPSRTLLEDRLQLALARAVRDGDQLAVVSARHGAPERASRSEMFDAGRRLHGVMSPWETVAYLGEGRFVALFEQVADEGAAQTHLEFLRAALEEPGADAPGWTFGLALGPLQAASANALIRAAESGQRAST